MYFESPSPDHHGQYSPVLPLSKETGLYRLYEISLKICYGLISLARDFILAATENIVPDYINDKYIDVSSSGFL